LQQVVAFRNDFIESEEKGENTIRRVVGLPGDTIEIKDGKVYRNDSILREDYVTGITEGQMNPVILGEDEIFVLADNRTQGIDSRDPRVGPLKMNLLRGYCAFKVWPVNEVGGIQ